MLICSKLLSYLVPKICSGGKCISTFGVMVAKYWTLGMSRICKLDIANKKFTILMDKHSRKVATWKQGTSVMLIFCFDCEEQFWCYWLESTGSEYVLVKVFVGDVSPYLLLLENWFKLLSGGPEPLNEDSCKFVRFLQTLTDLLFQGWIK
jgi:hypothetical protein